MANKKAAVEIARILLEFQVQKIRKSESNSPATESDDSTDLGSSESDLGESTSRERGRKGRSD